MFSGSYDHVLDDKGRTSLPKEFRRELAADKGGAWVTALAHCLAIYPAAEFEALRSKLAEASKLDASVQHLQRLITGMAQLCPIDRQGRILIPPKNRAWAGLDREIVFAGVGARIEVWDRARHQAELEQTRQHFDDYTRDLREFGL
jgi:MraZ protein